MSKKILLILTFFVSVTFISTEAYATLITPKRVIIKQGQRAGGLTIYNRGDEPMVYTFEWERRAQMPDGATAVLEEGETLAGYKPADEMLLFSPRRVVLNPGQSQKLRILARRPADLPEGEYHSHIKIKPDPLNEKEEAVAAEKGFGGVVKIRTHMSIPVFLIHGKTHLDYEYEDIKIFEKEGRDYLSFAIQNNGSTRSAYSNHTLECGTPDGIIEISVGTTRVYTEVQRITEELPTPKKAPPLSSCSSLDLKIYPIHDIEYKITEPYKTYKLR